jgi:hypothetical protein
VTIPSDDDMLAVATSLMDELAKLHAAYKGHDLSWLSTPSGMRRKPEDSEMASRRAQFVVSALDQFADDMPPVFRRLGDLYAARSLDIIAGRTGFYDWAVAGRGPGVRDVAYFLCNSLPFETRRSHGISLLTRCRTKLAEYGVMLDEHAVHEQYRLFSVYSWIAAASTAAMGSRWQPIDVSRAAMVSTTQAVEDLDAIGLLEERLGSVGT